MRERDCEGVCLCVCVCVREREEDEEEDGSYHTSLI